MAWTTINASETDADSPLNQVLMDKIRTDLDHLYSIRFNYGWHGYAGRVQIFPADFSLADLVTPFNLTGAYIQLTNVALGATIYAHVPIPAGYSATAARVYGDNTSATFEVFDCRLDDGTSEVSKGSATAINTELDITDVTAGNTKYLSIKVIANANADKFYGGYVTITEN